MTELQSAPAHQVRRLRLGNGLEVVLSQEQSSPTVAVGVFYKIGFRLEPEGRTGFAHLFEHLMFEGTPNVSQVEFGERINRAGGMLNGNTRHECTTYFEVLPSSALELALFLESDRMRALKLTEENLANQIEVVKQEVRLQVLSQPYGGFSWLWLGQYAFSTYPNAHNYYGEFADLEAATIAEAEAFYQQWYGPSNACLVLVGDFDLDQASNLVERYFGDLPARPAPERPNVDEPAPDRRREFTRTDPMAPTPRVALGYRTAAFEDPAHLPLILAARVLTDGRSSRLVRRLVSERQLLLDVEGGPHYPLGPFEFRGPALFTFELVPRQGVSTKAAAEALDQEIASFVAEGPTEKELLRAKRRELSAYHAKTDSRLGRMQELGIMSAVHDRPELVDELPQRFQQVTGAEVQQAVRDWLRPEVATVLHWLPETKNRGRRG